MGLLDAPSNEGSCGIASNPARKSAIDRTRYRIVENGSVGDARITARKHPLAGASRRQKEESKNCLSSSQAVYSPWR